jgi:hypothetical protein
MIAWKECDILQWNIEKKRKDIQDQSIGFDVLHKRSTKNQKLNMIFPM